MKQQNTLQPKLRFPEFRGDWESDKFKSYVKLNQGLQIPISERFTEYVPNSYYYITNEFLNKNSSKSYYIVNPSNSVICKESDILMTRTGNTGKVVTNVKGAFHNNFFKISYNSNVYKDFLYFYLIHPKIQHIILSRAGTSTIPDLNHSDFYSINFVHPSLTEQQKIADYLTTIDKKIELLEEKKTELSRYKKAMMQKLFAQEIRFKDENGNDYPEWEEKRLGDVFNSFNGLTGKTKENFGFGKPYIKYTQVFGSSKIDVGGFDLVEITANDKQNQAQYGDAFFTVSSETPHEVGMSSVLLDEVDEVYLNSFCFGIRPKSQNLNPHYYRYFFRSKNFRKEVVKLAQGSTRYNMSKVEFMKINIEIPSLPEQQKIADFLSAIDESITKVEEQIKETQNFKKAMLQQMFV